jgi:hypothetical protein
LTDRFSESQEGRRTATKTDGQKDSQASRQLEEGRQTDRKRFLRQTDPINLERNLGETKYRQKAGTTKEKQAEKAKHVQYGLDLQLHCGQNKFQDTLTIIKVCHHDQSYM